VNFNVAAIKKWMDDGQSIIGHPLARLAFPFVLGLLPKFGQISDEDMAALKAHEASYDAMAAEARRRAGQ
jgi:hypothetical protein